MNDDYDIWQYNAANTPPQNTDDVTDIWSKSAIVNPPQSSPDLSLSNSANPIETPDLTFEPTNNLDFSEQSLGFETDTFQELSFTQPEHQDFAMLNSARSTCSNQQPYLTINQSGDVYRHDTDSSWHNVGYVRHNTYYNNHWDEIGYLKNGHYYDSKHDKIQGSVCGANVYDNHHHKIAVADTATEGGAWIAFIEHGGIA